MNYMDSPKSLANLLRDFDFQNGKPSMFDGRTIKITEEIGKTKDLRFVVILNHHDRIYFVARSVNIKAYLRSIASFLSGHTSVYSSIMLRRAFTEKNAAHWNIEVMDGTMNNIIDIRQKLSGWREMGTKNHKARLGGIDVDIYKVTHTETGWSRYASHRVSSDPIPVHVATQSLGSLISKTRRRPDFNQQEITSLVVFYQAMKREIDKNPNCLKVEVVKTISSSEVNVRASDYVKENNIINQAVWENSDLVKDLLHRK